MTPRSGVHLAELVAIMASGKNRGRLGGQLSLD